MELFKKKWTWVSIIIVILLIVIIFNLPTILATLSYVSQETELEKSDYSINGSELTIKLSEIPDLSSVGGAVTIVDETLPSYILIARVNTDEYLVVSSQCPHRGHAMDYVHEDAVIKCSSLGSETFDLEGNYIGGPESKDLPKYVFHIEGSLLIVDLSSYE